MALPVNFAYDSTVKCAYVFLLLQSLLPNVVTTNMSKVKKQSLFTPSPATYARSAVGTIGILSRTSGYWPHSFMVSVCSRLKTLQYGTYCAQPHVVLIDSSKDFASLAVLVCVYFPLKLAEETGGPI